MRQRIETGGAPDGVIGNTRPQAQHDDSHAQRDHGVYLGKCVGTRRTRYIGRVPA